MLFVSVFLYICIFFNFFSSPRPSPPLSPQGSAGAGRIRVCSVYVAYTSVYVAYTSRVRSVRLPGSAGGNALCVCGGEVD
jgi:hypothetical protein